jgi:hypothetical protein
MASTRLNIFLTDNTRQTEPDDVSFLILQR